MSTDNPPAISATQLIEMIDAAVQRWSGDDPMAMIRRAALLHLRELIGKNGFHLSENQKREGCLMPALFQELNYDDCDWSDRTADLGPLQEMVEIDVLAWSGGLRRCDLTDSQYKKYWRHCLGAIDYRQSLLRSRPG